MAKKRDQHRSTPPSPPAEAVQPESPSSVAPTSAVETSEHTTRNDGAALVLKHTIALGEGTRPKGTLLGHRKQDGTIVPADGIYMREIENALRNPQLLQ